MSEKNTADIRHLVEIHTLINFAENLSVETVAVANIEPVYPVTVGEKLVNYVLHIVLTSEWIYDASEDAVGEISDILNQLDTGVDSIDKWQMLFDANKKLGLYIQDI